MIKHHNPFLLKRMPEWIAAMLMLSAAIHTYCAGTLYQSVGYDLFDAFHIDRGYGLAAMFLIGIVRTTALTINGAWKRTPMIRANCSGISAMYFGLLFLGGYPVVWPLIVGDIISSYQAGQDARAVTRTSVRE